MTLDLDIVGQMWPIRYKFAEHFIDFREMLCYANHLIYSSIQYFRPLFSYGSYDLEVIVA